MEGGEGLNNQEYIEGIASIIKNYRKTELNNSLDILHVQKWVEQFSSEEQSIVLEETFHVLTRYYINEERIYTFLNQVLKHIINEEIVSNVIFADIQEQGNSQKRIYKYIENKGNYIIQKENFIDDSKLYIYIDDGLYSGKRARDDIGHLLSLLPPGARLNVYYMIVYSDGFNYWSNKLRREAMKKNITVRFYYGRKYINNRMSGFEKYEFLWPDKTCAEDSEIESFENKLRETRRMCCPYCYIEDNKGVCSTSENNKKLTKIFLKYGIEIVNAMRKSSFLPLGFGFPISFGFGAFSINEWNIANNCPLVLWWGDIDNPNNMVGSWYPLFPRRDNKTFYEEICQEEKIFSLENNKDILKTIYKLSLDEYQNERTNKETWEEVIRTIDIYEPHREREESNLYQYMNSLDMNAIKIIQTVMYIGRDYTFENAEYYYDEFDRGGVEEKREKLPVVNPEFIVMSWLKDLSNGRGWEEKSIEIEQIYSKRLRLYEYLKRAFEILGIMV